MAIVALAAILCAGCQTATPILPDCPRPAAYWQADDPLEPVPEYRVEARRARALMPLVAARLNELEKYCWSVNAASR